MPRDRNADLRRAVIDRIVDEWAVLLVGTEEQEHRVRVNDLPEGAREGSIVDIRVSGTAVEVVAIDIAATDEKRAEMKGRLNDLKRSRSSGRFAKGE